MPDKEWPSKPYEQTDPELTEAFGEYPPFPDDLKAYPYQPDPEITEAFDGRAVPPAAPAEQ